MCHLIKDMKKKMGGWKKNFMFAKPQDFPFSSILDEVFRNLMSLDPTTTGLDRIFNTTGYRKSCCKTSNGLSILVFLTGHGFLLSCYSYTNYSYYSRPWKHSTLFSILHTYCVRTEEEGF